MKQYHFKKWYILLFVFLVACNSPNTPTWEELDTWQRSPIIVSFEWENPVQKSQWREGAVYLQGRLLSTGDTILYHWHGIPKAYKDLAKTEEVELRLHSNYPDNIRFVPQGKGGHGKWINLYTVYPCSVEDVKVLEIKMEFDIIISNQLPVRYGRTLDYTLTYIFK